MWRLRRNRSPGGDRPDPTKILDQCPAQGGGTDAEDFQDVDVGSVAGAPAAVVAARNLDKRSPPVHGPDQWRRRANRTRSAEKRARSLETEQLVTGIALRHTTVPKRDKCLFSKTTVTVTVAGSPPRSRSSDGNSWRTQSGILGKPLSGRSSLAVALDGGPPVTSTGGSAAAVAGRCGQVVDALGRLAAVAGRKSNAGERSGEQEQGVPWARAQGTTARGWLRRISKGGPITWVVGPPFAI